MDKLSCYVKALTATSPARESDPLGTADNSRLDYTRWQYDAETEKERLLLLLFVGALSPVNHRGLHQG